MKKQNISKAILAFGGNVTKDTINNLSADTIKNLSADTINNLSADTIKNLSADTIKNLSAYTINNLSAYTINNLSADTIKNLSADTIKKIEELWNLVPLIEDPYTHLLNDIKAKKRIHQQSTYGPDYDPKENLCGTQMCTAGHLVNMGGKEGYKLKDKYGWEKAAGLIHLKVHPDMPTQNFGSIDQSFAISYIEMGAEFEQRKNKDLKFDEWLKTII